MAWQELLALFQSNPADSPDGVLTRVIAKIEELIAALETVELAEKDKAAAAATRVKWRAAGFSCVPLDELAEDVDYAGRKRLRSVCRNIQATVSKLQTWSADPRGAEVQEARDALLSSRRELELFSGTVRAEARRSRLMRGGLLLLPVLLGSASMYYLRSDRGLQLEQIEALSPAGAYSKAARMGGTLTLQPDYVADYMYEFSKYYFGYQSQFESIYYDRPDDSKDPKDGKDTKDGKDSKEDKASREDKEDKGSKPKGKRRTQQHKIVLRNVSHGHTAYLSSLEAVIDVVEKTEFPWARLSVTPRVTAVVEAPPIHNTLLIKSDGIGPALDVKATLTSKTGLVLWQHEVPILHQDRLSPFRQVIVDQVGVHADDGKLERPLYQHMKVPPARLGPQHIEVKAPRPGTTGTPSCSPNTNAADYGVWEEVRAVSRLQQITQTAYAEPYTLDVRYASLRGPQEPLRFTGTLDKSEAYYRGTTELRSVDPRCMWTDHDVDEVSEAPSRSIEALAFLFAPEKELVHPKGTDLITARLGIDLQGLSVGRHVAALQPIDGFLNPQGVLSIHLTMNAPSNYRYAVRILVGGREAASYRFEALDPEHVTFAQEGPTAAVARLRKIFTAAK